MSSEAKQLQPRISAKNASFATVLVGPDAEHFVVHESLLIHCSKFFRATLTGRFKEAKEKTVKLEDTKPDIFEFFVHWLYYQRFPDSKKGDNSDLVEAWTSGAHAELGFHKKYMIDLFIFGDRYEVPRLRNDAISHIFLGFRRSAAGFPSKSEIKYAFEQLFPTTPLCQYFVHLRAKHEYIRSQNGDIWGIHASDKWPHAYVLEYARYTSRMISELCDGKRSDIVFNLILCDYHDHSSDEERSVCKDCQEKEA